MADVACFCGYGYSFDGDSGACPSCGESTILPTAPAYERALSEELERLAAAPAAARPLAAASVAR
jgi:hypothetical protein